jgi:hypothetical protein
MRKAGHHLRVAGFVVWMLLDELLHPNRPWP